MARPVKTLPVVRGKDIEFCVGLPVLGDRTLLSSEALTTGATETAKGATTVTLTAAPSQTIPAGAAFSFVDSSDRTYFVQATEDITTGSITCAALAEAIPAGAVAQYPPRFLLRTTADLSKSGEAEEIDTFDHTDADQLHTKNTSEISAEGFYSWKDGAREIIEFAYANKREIYWSRQLPAPSAAYSLGEKEEGFAIITSVEKPGTNEESVKFNVSLSIVGAVTRTAPTPVA